jgi:hypothetical protein
VEGTIGDVAPAERALEVGTCDKEAERQTSTTRSLLEACEAQTSNVIRVIQKQTRVLEQPYPVSRSSIRTASVSSVLRNKVVALPGKDHRNQ